MGRTLIVALLAAVLAGTTAFAFGSERDEARVVGDAATVVAPGAAAALPARVPTRQRMQRTTTAPPATGSGGTIAGKPSATTGEAAKRSSSRSATVTTTATTVPRPKRLPSWRDAPAASASACGSVGRSVVVDRAWQRAWLCDEGAVAGVIPVTSAIDQPDVGVYAVYAMDERSSSSLNGRQATLDRFIAFTRGKYQGLRIGFHAVPYYDDGSLLQPMASVGRLSRAGDSLGCIRVRPEHATLLFSFLRLGDEVRVVS